MFRVLILIVALVAGGAAAWLVLNTRPRPDTIVQAPPPVPTQDVLVASGDFGIGQTLTGEGMRWQPWPENLLNAGYITRSAEPDAQQALEGAILRSRIAGGEPILKAKLVPKNSGFLSAMLPSGKLAVAVRISAENTAGGFILPNDRVDVLHTGEAGDGHGDEVTRTILTNVIVLAIDQTVDESAGGEKDKAKPKSATIGKTATLEVDNSQAELLTAAEAKGRISLALRSSADNGNPAVTLKPQPQLQAQPQPQPAPSPTVRLVRGGKSEVVKLD